MSTYAADLFDLELLGKMMREGYVKATPHPTEDLTIYNYTPKAQYDNVWNPVTMQCRGLILGNGGQVIARPFPKFFNWDQPAAPRVPVGPVRFGEKMDGSLGILHLTSPGQSVEDYAIATRGSFTSEQAIEGTRIFHEMVESTNFDPSIEHTYLFEIIYPQNRIVVNYGDRSTLVLLDVIDNRTGKSDLTEFNDIDWPEKVEYHWNSAFDHTMIEEIPDGNEGIVLYWWGPDVRLKMKAAEYVRLHRIVTNTSSKTIWEHLSEEKSISSLLDNVPDEFYAWVEETVEDMWRKFVAIQVAADMEYRQISEAISWNEVGLPWDHTDDDEWTRAYRKLFAEKAKRSQYSDILFALLSGKPWRQMVWKRIKPDYSRPFANQTEDNN